MRISDWSSDVCSSDLFLPRRHPFHHLRSRSGRPLPLGGQPGRNRLGRLGDDDGFPRRTDARPCICLEERGVGLGMTRSPIITDTRGLTPEGVAPGLHLPEGTPPDRGFFDDLNSEVGEKGFLVTSTEDLFNWARTEIGR